MDNKKKVQGYFDLEIKAQISCVEVFNFSEDEVKEILTSVVRDEGMVDDPYLREELDMETATVTMSRS